MELKIEQPHEFKDGEEINEVQKAKILQTVSQVFDKGGFCLVGSKQSHTKDEMTLVGNAYVNNVNKIKVVETVIGMLQFTNEELVVLFARAVEYQKLKDKK